MRCALGPLSRCREPGRSKDVLGRQAGGVAPVTLILLAGLLLTGSAMANELVDITITSNPGSDDTYSSDGEDSTIVFRSEWTGRVSVRGADLVFMLGDEEQRANCPSSDERGVGPELQFDCMYEVQPGDLDEDGVSIPAGPPFTGSITRGDSRINQANCTTATSQECPYAGMRDNPAHKVDGGPAEATEPEPPVQGGTGGDRTDRIASTLLAIGPPQIGSIDDVDYYRIDLAGSATMTVGTAGRADTRGELLDGTGALIASDEGSGPGGNNFSMTETLAPGVYYVAVSAPPGSVAAGGGYALTALLADAGDQGGSAASSSLLTLYGAAQVARVTESGLSSALLSTVGHIDDAMADLDYFRIDVPRDGTDVTVRSAGGTDTAGRLLDSALMEVAADDGGSGNFRMETTLDAGIYYLEVMGEVGRYRVVASGSDPDCDCAEPATMAMDHGGTAETSTLMSIGPPLTGEISGADDVDVFRIDLAGSAAVVFEAAGPTDTMGVLRDAAGAELAAANTGGPASNFRISEELAPGVYYLEVSGAGGSYAVSAQLGGESDHGDTAGLSTLLTFYGEDDVANIRPSALLSTAAAIDAAETDMDVFRLDIPQDSTDVTIRSVGSLDTFARLRDASLLELAMDDGDAGFRIETTLDAGVYYIEVGGHETGRYRILAWGDSREDCACADGDGDDDP